MKSSLQLRTSSTDAVSTVGKRHRRKLPVLVRCRYTARMPSQRTLHTGSTPHTIVRTSCNNTCMSSDFHRAVLALPYLILFSWINLSFVSFAFGIFFFPADSNNAFFTSTASSVKMSASRGPRNDVTGHRESGVFRSLYFLSGVFFFWDIVSNCLRG